jgi:hypothetical protein
MKLSPQLLRSVALGIGLSAALTSCGILETEKLADHNDKCSKEVCSVDCEKAAEEALNFDNCPGCGMG